VSGTNSLFGRTSLPTAAKENLSSFGFLRFVPRVLNAVSSVDTSSSLFGRQADLPLFFAPTGGSALAHPNGEFNVLEIAARTGIPQCISADASRSLPELFARRDELEKEGRGRARLWWQLYVRRDRELTERQLQQAVGGGVEAVLFTVDAPVGCHCVEGRPSIIRRSWVTGRTMEECPKRETWRLETSRRLSSMPTLPGLISSGSNDAIRTSSSF
jgi:isopentenyl diphosphate isomerase/L-lactate dehydrogenase-like FMN-dependent dehydrogenase